MNPKRPKDTNQRAKFIMGIATGEEQDLNPDENKNPSAVALGKLGGKKRAENLTDERRKEIAQNAGKKRWENKDEK